ncbi:E3 ubiquitin-protein ligase UBR5-like [Sycon ciliatum]|uniref:E3 ubiquitin-protein ligase UBR5-like n=1 Tax=Sycon ciliatum TaxID=27933 RepID=UPI0031F67B68
MTEENLLASGGSFPPMASGELPLGSFPLQSLQRAERDEDDDAQSHFSINTTAGTGGHSPASSLALSELSSTAATAASAPGVGSSMDDAPPQVPPLADQVTVSAPGTPSLVNVAAVQLPQQPVQQQPHAQQLPPMQQQQQQDEMVQFQGLGVDNFWPQQQQVGSLNPAPSSAMGPGEDNTGVHQLAEVAVRSMLDSGQLFNAGTAPNDPTRLTPSCSVATSASQTSTPQPALAKSSVAMEAVVPVPETMSPYLARSCEDLAGDAFECLIVLCAHDLLKPYLLTLLSHKNAAGFTPFQAAVTNRAYRAASQICMRALLISAKNESEFVSMCDKERAATQASEKSSDHDADTRKHSEAGQEGLTSQLSSNLGAQSRRLTGLGRGKLGAVHFQEEDMPEDGEDDNEDEDEDEDGDEEGHVIVDDDDEDDGDAEEDMASMGAASAESPPGSGALSPVLPESGDSDLLPSSASSDVSGGDGNMRLSPNFVAGAVAAAVAATNAGAVSAASGGESAAPAAADLFRIDTDAANKDLLAISERLSNAAGAADVEQPAGPPLDAAAAAPPPAVEEESAAGAIGSSQLALGGPQQQQYGENREVERSSSLSAMDVAANEVAPNVVHPVHSISIRETLAGVGEKKAGETQEAGPGMECAYERHNQELLNRMLCPSDSPAKDNPLFILAHNGQCSYVWSKANHISQKIYNCYTCGLTDQTCCCTTCANVCHGNHVHAFKHMSSAYCDCSLEANAGQCRALVAGDQQARIDLFHKLLRYTQLGKRSDAQGQPLLLLLARLVSQQVTEQKNRSGTSTRNSAFASSLIDRKLNLAEVNKFIDASNFCEVAMCICLDNWTAASAILLSGTTQARLLLGEVAQSDVVRMLSDSETEALVASQDGSQHLDCFVHALTLGSTFENTHNLNLLVKTILQARQCEQTKELAEKAARRLVRSFTRVLVSEQTECSLRRLKSTKCIDSSKLRALREFGIMAVEEMLDTAMTLIRPVMLGHVTDAAPLNMTSTSAAAVADPNYPSLAAGAAASARNVDQSTVHTLLSMPPLLQRRDGVAQAPSSSGGGSFPELPRAGARMSDSEESDGDDDDAGHGEQAMVVDEPAPAASASAAAAAASAGQSAPAAGADVAESSLAQVADDGAGSPSGSEAEASSPAEDFPGASSPHHEHMASEDAFTESDLEPESEDSFFDSSDDDGNFDHLVLRQLRQVAAGAPGSSTVERARQQAAVAAAASSGRSAAAGSSASSISAAAVAAAGTRLSAVAAAAAAAASSAPGSGAAPGGGGGVVTRSSQAFSSPSLDWVIDQSSLELPAAPALSASRVRRQRRRHSSWFGSSSTAAAGDGGDGNPEPAAASAPGPSMEAILTASSRQGAASVLCRSFGCCIKIIFQMVSVTMRAGQCTTEVLEPCIPGMPEEKLVTRNLIKMKLQPVWDWLMMRLDKVESDLRRGAVIASCKPIPADPSTSASLSSKPATTPSSGDIFMLKFLMDTMRSAAGENGDNLPSIQVHSLPHLLHLLEAMLHIVSLSATSPAGTTHCQSCVEYATPESAEAATTTAATTSTGCGSTASDTPRCSMDQLASATSVTSASGRVPIATDPSHHSSFFTRSPCLGMVGALSPSSRSRCKDSILLAGNPYLLEASKRQELLVGPPNQCLADWVQPRSSQCSSLGMFAPPRDLSHSSRVTEYPAPSTADRATADLEGTRLEERCHDLALENYERMSITTAAVAGRWRFFLEKLWPVFSKDMKDSELSHVMDRTLPFHVRESKFRRELEQTLDLRMRNPAEVHLKVTRGPQALADCFVGLNAHGSASDLPPCAFLGFLKVDFKDEPAEGSGVIRNLFTVVAEILESNHTLPKYTTSSPAIFTSTRVRVPASAYNRLSKPESTLTAEEKGVARDELWWSDIQKSPSRSIGANLSGHTMQMRKACLGDRLAARLLDHRDAAKVVASMVDHAPAWLLLQFLEDNALLHKHYRHVCLTLQNHSVLRNEWVDLEEAEDSNPVYFQGKVAVFESEQESLFYPGKETGFFSLRPGPATALRDNAYVNVGRMIGLALLHGCIFPLRLGRHVFKYLLRRPVCWHDLAFIDPTLYEGLRSLLDTARSENAKEQFVGISLTFRTPISHDLGGDAVDLFENGDGIAVTPENVDVYVERVATWHMLESASRGLQCMRLGLENVIDPERLSNLSPEDLRLLLNGSHTVDVALLERLTDYECGEKTSIERTYEIRKWFWSILRSMTSAQLAELMYFWTSSPAMPTAMDGKVASIVFRPPDHNRLPTANTCISRLYIPLYRSKQVLRARLLMAIKTREFGFV